MRFRVVIVNGGAISSAYEEDRRPKPGEGKRTVHVDAVGMSGINAVVQEQMMAEGFQQSEWKVLSWEEE